MNFTTTTQKAKFVDLAGRLKGSRLYFRGGLRMLPILLILTYLVALLALFLLWPINWQIFHASAWIRLTAYVLACYGFILLGYLAGTGPTKRVSAPLKSAKWAIVFGAIIGFVLLFPISRIYTGRWPWEVLSVIDQQGEAYKDLQEQLEQTAGQRGLIAFVRAIFSPFTFAVIPLGFLYWYRLNWIQRGFVGLAIATTVLISLLRGTDREFVDLTVVGVGALLVALARSRSKRAGLVEEFLRRYWIILFAGVFFLGISASLFADRKSARLGGIEDRTAVCANTSRICADIDAPLIAWMPLQARFATSMFIISSASGFYGLELAMEKDFKSTFGVGHSPATLAAYELLTGDGDLKRRTFTYRNGFEGWSEQNYWSTLMAWIANDVGFPGALLSMLFVGWAFGFSWRSATIGNSDAAAVIFCAMMIVMFYLTANNQFFGAYDGYFVATFWVIVWWREKRHLIS